MSIKDKIFGSGLCHNRGESISEVITGEVDVDIIPSPTKECHKKESIEDYEFGEELLFPPVLIRGDLLQTDGRTKITGENSKALFGGGCVVDIDPNFIPSPSSDDVGKFMVVTAPGQLRPMVIGNTSYQLSVYNQDIDFQILNAIPKNYMITSIVLRGESANEVDIKIGTTNGGDELGFVTVGVINDDDTIITLNKSFNASFKTLFFTSENWNNAIIDVCVNYIRSF